MKKFIRNVCILIVLAMFFAFGINTIYMNKYNKINPDNIKKFEKIPDKIDICNFGSSHGMCGFNYEDIDDEYDCFNFALNSQYLSYDYRLFLNYREHFDEETVVIIPISYFVLFGKNESETVDFVAKNKRYYSFMRDDLIKNYDLFNKIIIKYVPSLGASTKNLISTIFADDSDVNEKNWNHCALDIDMAANLELRYAFHIKNGKLDQYGNRIINQEEVDALYNLIGGLEEIGVTPILVTTPFTQDYTDYIAKNDPKFYDDFYAIVNEVVKNTGVKYYDYAFDERFKDNYELFMDSDHLNKDGAKKFVDVLMQEVIN